MSALTVLWLTIALVGSLFFAFVMLMGIQGAGTPRKVVGKSSGTEASDPAEEISPKKKGGWRRAFSSLPMVLVIIGVLGGGTFYFLQRQPGFMETITTSAEKWFEEETPRVTTFSRPALPTSINWELCREYLGGAGRCMDANITEYHVSDSRTLIVMKYYDEDYRGNLYDGTCRMDTAQNAYHGEWVETGDSTSSGECRIEYHPDASAGPRFTGQITCQSGECPLGRTTQEFFLRPRPG